MTPLGDVSTHLNLVRRMALATGTDLAEAMLEGDLSSADWAQMVTNCRGCACPEACKERLSAIEAGDAAAETPDYCANRATFDRLDRHSA